MQTTAEGWARSTAVVEKPCEGLVSFVALELSCLMDLIYTEANIHIRAFEAHADAEHSRRLAFVQQGTNVLITQLNSEISAYKAESEAFQSRLLHSEVECHEERQAAQQFTSQGTALTTRALRFETALKHSEQLRTLCEENRSTLLEYLAKRFEEKLQWEENDSLQKLKVEEMQHDDLVTDLICFPEGFQSCRLCIDFLSPLNSFIRLV